MVIPSVFQMELCEPLSVLHVAVGLEQHVCHGSVVTVCHILASLVLLVSVHVDLHSCFPKATMHVAM